MTDVFHTSPLISVLLVNFSPAFMRATSEVLRKDNRIEIIGLYSNSTRLLHSIQALEPDIVLVDMDLLNQKALEIITQVHTAYPSMRLIGLSLGGPADFERAALNAGATVYMDKASLYPGLLEVIEKLIK